ncbi:formylglycine-generating enzyme family protein [Stenomitos frigidus ULC18]|uniref:Formylglycine-generating enzyme family protein n=2 Tax=Stenomitos TaxID=1844270 RepID=A0A2T1EMJ8_9CYAN|nr:formylglycine-generating enzyme family protein [Stenomitos frigidus ULC18]
MPRTAKPDTTLAETPEQGLPIQVQAAPALAHPRDIARSLRPLMRKVPSLTRSELDELATVNRIAERDLWLPILKPSPERWFDLELVIEASKFSFIWQDTLDEFQQLLECQGAFRNVRTWSVKESATGQPQLVAKPQRRAGIEQDLPLRSHKELVDTSGRRLVLFVSDCRSQLWQQGQIHDWLALWGQHGPTAIVQLLPERLWSQSELDVGFSVQVSSLLPGAPNPKLQVKELPVRTEIAPVETLTVPIVTLTASALKQWALVVAAAGRQRSPARLFDRSWVTDPERDRSRAVIRPKSARERVELFMATASPLAQRLASLMAAVPVELPVVHLIQQELLEAVQPVHIAEVYSSGLLEEIYPNPVKPAQAKPDASVRYDFVQDVRGLLNEITPLDETLGVLEALSKRIARTLGFEIRSFTALLSPKADWTQEAKAAILPFAQIATEVLHRLGGDYAELAQLVEDDAQGRSDWIQPLETDPVFPDLAILTFTTAQLFETAPASPFPPLQTQSVEVVTIVLEEDIADTQPISDWQLLEFEVATLERQTDQPQTGFFRNLFQRGEQRSEWVIRKQRQQRVGLLIEPLTARVELEMVLLPVGTFVMGSPEAEPERSAAEGPQHTVSLESFLMGRYPVTQAQWRAVAAMPQINRRLEPDPSLFKGNKRPVERVSWEEAVEFCDRVSAHTGRAYRLPTEAEWEYACRAGTTTPFHFGETITTDLVNYNGDYTYANSPKGKARKETTAVDAFGIANAFGLCDMHGNVWEWCQDHWHENYKGAPTDGSAWLTDDKRANRVPRGGSWLNNPRHCRSASRSFNAPDSRDDAVGFRVVCSAP